MNMLQDIIIGVLLLFGLVSGFISGGIKKGLRLVITLGIFFGCYYVFKDIAVDFLRYDLLSLVTNGAGLQVQVDPTLTIKVMNFEDLFIILQNADENLTAVQLKATCEVLFTVIFFVCLLICSEVVSFPITFILYHLIFKFVFFRAGKKPKFFLRFLGGIFGVLEVLIFVYFYAVSFGQFTSLFKEVLLIIEAVPEESRGSLNQYLGIAQQLVNSLSYESSIIISGLLNVMSNSGIDPFALVSVSVAGSNEKVTLPKAIEGIHDAAFDSIVDFIKQMFSGSSETPPVENGEVASLYNLGFNF